MESRIPVTLREVSLKNKPAELLRFSKKGTVPVLVTDLGRLLTKVLHHDMASSKRSSA